MKKLILALAFLAITMPAKAATSFTIGDVTFNIPLANVSGVYLYDLINRETLLGVETKVASYKNVTAVIGAVGDIEKAESRSGVPFLGFHVQVPADWTTETFQAGIFGGRDFKRGENIAGVKASLKIWGNGQ